MQSRQLTLGGLTPYFPADYEYRLIRLEPNVTIAMGTVLSEINGSGVFTPYRTGLKAVCLLEYDCKTDGGGRAWYYLAMGEEYRPFEKVSSFVKGSFRCQDLVGLDMNAVIDLGRLIEGSVTAGILKVC